MNEKDREDFIASLNDYDEEDSYTCSVCHRIRDVYEHGLCTNPNGVLRCKACNDLPRDVQETIIRRRIAGI